MMICLEALHCTWGTKIVARSRLVRCAAKRFANKALRKKVTAHPMAERKDKIAILRKTVSIPCSFPNMAFPPPSHSIARATLRDSWLAGDPRRNPPPSDPRLIHLAVHPVQRPHFLPPSVLPSEIYPRTGSSSPLPTLSPSR